MLRSCIAGQNTDEAQAEFEGFCSEVDSDLAFIRQANIGGEFMHDADIERVHAIAKRTIEIGGQSTPF